MGGSSPVRPGLFPGFVVSCWKGDRRPKASPPRLSPRHGHSCFASVGLQGGNSGVTLKIIFAVVLLCFITYFLASEVLLYTKELERFRDFNFFFLKKAI